MTEEEKKFIGEMQNTKPLYQDWMVVEIEPNWFALDCVALAGNLDAKNFIPSGCTSSGIFGNFRIRGVHV